MTNPAKRLQSLPVLHVIRSHQAARFVMFVMFVMGGMSLWAVADPNRTAAKGTPKGVPGASNSDPDNRLLTNHAQGGYVIQENHVMTQEQFGDLVGISQPAVSGLLQGGVIKAGDPWRVWLLNYCSRLREQAAGRMGATGSADLTHERALLARAQREGQELKNAAARGTYAPIELLSDVLATASQAVVDRLDQIPAALRRTCPHLPRAALDAVMAEINSARNEMARKAESLLGDLLDDCDQPADDEPEYPAPADDIDAANLSQDL